jgi:methylenetetrahydrofolate reductase (NADPH)
VGGLTEAAVGPEGETMFGCAAADFGREWLKGYSAEVTTPDRQSLDAAAEMMWPQAPVYVASLPKDSSEAQLAVAAQLHGLGLRPVPHVVARNFASEAAFARAIERFAREAGVDRVLVLAGDRQTSEGPFECSLQLIRSGVFEANGVRKIAIACYPEGHPRIAHATLDRALMEKLEAADRAGLEARLITQLCFDADVISRFVKKLRSRGIGVGLRVGLAGPATPARLLKYAAICGVGPSLRALRERQSMARGLLAAQTPEPIVAGLARAAAADRSLDITGLHFFTFASLRHTIEWAREAAERAPSAWEARHV